MSHLASAQTSAPAAPAGTPVATSAVTAPPVQPAPAAPAGAPVPAARVEETRPQMENNSTVPTQPPATTPPPSSLANRVTAIIAAVKGKGSPVEALSAKDQEIANLRSQVESLTAQLQTLTAQNAQATADLKAITAALGVAEQTQATVVDTVAALGFPTNQLPGAQDIDNAKDGSPKGHFDEWQRLKKEGLRGEASAYRAKHEAQIRAYAATQPQTF